jgi:murein tripeptide amidase MpaA
MTWTEYHNLEAIYLWMDSLANRTEVEVLSVGTTIYERDIKGVKISFGPGKRGVFFESGIHAREWIAPATATYLINELLNSQNPRFRRIAESFDWHIFPVINPDGYSYTFTDVSITFYHIKM